MLTRKTLLMFLCFSLLSWTVACDDTEEDTGDDANNTANNNTGDISVALNFKGAVNGEDFACGTTYSGVGTTSSDMTPADFRLYIHGIELLTEDGTAVPLELDQDSPFQTSDVVLLDFEDKSGPCSNGTTETNTQATGTAPAGTYTGVRFVLGVPFELNHADAAVAESPLNLTAMFWNWQGGYKFMRLEGATTDTADAARIHLGSTGCETDDAGATTECSNPNRPTITLEDFDLTSNTIVADLGTLLAGSDINANTDMTPPGCMSSASDPECAPILERFGISGTQAFFSAQ